MVPRKFVSLNDASPLSVDPTNFSKKVHEKAKLEDPESSAGPPMEADVDIDLAEVYFLIMHFLSTGPCQRTCGHFLNELLEHQLLPRRYHAWYSRSGLRSGYEEDNGLSFPLSYNKFVERYPHIENDHLVKLLKQLLLSNAPPLHGMTGGNTPNAADVPTLLGSGSLSLLDSHKNREDKKTTQLPGYLRWPHMQADQVRGLCLREIGGGFRKHHRAPSIRAACYTIAKPSMMMQKMQITKKLRGHRDAVYCAIFDRAGRHVITGSDDRLVKIWSMETAFCLSSCRGHEGDITDLSVSSNNAVVASSSNDCTIRVWRLPDGLPISVLRGHTTAVTAIAFSPRPGAVYQLLSSSDDGSCRIWDARSSQFTPRVYIPKPPDVAGKSNGHPPNSMLQEHRIVCCAFNANGTAFVTGSSDACARVWSAVKFNSEDSNQPNHEMDVLSGHENVVNYVQFSGCAVPSRASTSDASKEENLPKFKNSWFTHDNIVTCSRDGSAIIWTPRSRKSHGKVGHWMRTYHLKVPPPPMPPRGGPRQKSLPTPRGVNMIVWSLDNRFVLAPITDCRICVWNAADGSLVHSLTGHSDSTYVLDVHPFNPRIAMSAGYDGKIIVWDIWDGSPVRIYETGHFKLVDGKFSPDGTSILLSDDVGQIYILSSGQGESHKDAKYDQFFLGDYHPLTQDTHGNVLDQETQLAPHRRNIQDLLCDSSLTPYPDPYQSMYQQRRLGALGIEWRPPPLKFSIGPAENGHPGIQDYQILPPLPDLDRLMEPLPEFVDTMDWQQENEVQSDDTDSEYNVPEEYVGEGEHGSVNAGSSSDLECTGEDSEDDNISKEGFRRSKRKKIKVDFTTSTGRRVKRKNLDEWDTSLKSNKRKKVKHGKSATRRRKSSASKSLRPQRLAARNALNLFSQINGASTDGEDEVSSESDLSDGESILPDSNIQSNDSDRSLQNVQQKHPRERETSPDVSETAVKPPKLPESQTNTGNRRRLVLKLSIRDSSKALPLESKKSECNILGNVMGLLDKALSEESYQNGTQSCSQDPVPSFVETDDAMLSKSCDGNNKIRWEEVKMLTSMSLGVGDTKHVCSDSDVILDGNHITEDITCRHLKLEEYQRTPINLENGAHQEKLDQRAYVSEKRTAILDALDKGRDNELAPACTSESLVVDEVSLRGHQEDKRSSPLTCNELKSQTRYSDKVYEDLPGASECRGHEPLGGAGMLSDDKTGTGYSCKSSPDCIQEVEERKPIIRKIRIKSKRIMKEPRSPSGLNSVIAMEDPMSSAGNLISESPMQMHHDLISGVPEGDDGASGSGHGNRNGWSGKLEKQVYEHAELPLAYNSKMQHLDSNGTNAPACKRPTSFRLRTNSEVNSCSVEESESNIIRYNNTDDVCGSRSTGMKATSQNRSSMIYNFEGREGHDSAETSRNAEKLTPNEHEKRGEWKSSSKVTVRLRSAKPKGDDYHSSELSFADRRKSYHSVRKLSWLMLSEHEESYRYIPQQGDEVAYLRQGHQEYIEWRGSREVGPWISIKGNLRAVEFSKVVRLDYSTLPGSGESCCKLTLKFIDPSSNVNGQIFRLTLPELVDFSDFLVERTRYDAAIRRQWTHRDKCQVWWRNENEEGGSWWEGRILSVKPKSLEFPDSPWERYVIQYRSDTSEQHLHSPWELHDLDSQWEHPHIDDWSREKLLSCFAKIEQKRNQDYYGIEKLKQVTQKSDFINRFPVPLSFGVIKRRLENNYYRSLDAFEHDIMVMISNAQFYFGKNTDLILKMRHLSELITHTLSKL